MAWLLNRKDVISRLIFGLIVIVASYWLFGAMQSSPMTTTSFQANTRGETKFVLVSDTHGIHSHDGLLKVPDGDVLLFAGDAGLAGEQYVRNFNTWLEKLPHRYKVVTFGNMDPWAEPLTPQERHAKLPAATHVLVDEIAEVAGFRVFASPFTPKFYGAFQLHDSADGERHWANKLPPDSDVDILLTHGPPHGYGDVTKGRHVGDKELLKAVTGLQRKPLLWVVGHIHNSYGKYQVSHPQGTIELYNAANNDLRTGQPTVPWTVQL